MDTYKIVVAILLAEAVLVFSILVSIPLTIMAYKVCDWVQTKKEDKFYKTHPRHVPKLYMDGNNATFVF